MPVHLEFRVTFGDYLDALRLHVKRSWWLRINWFGCRIIAPIWGVLIILFDLWMLTWGAHGFPFVFSMVAGLALVGYPYYCRSKLKRCFKRTRLGDGNRAYEFNESQIRARETGAKSEIEWNAVHSFAEDKNVFLLYLAPAKYIPIPKRICSENQIHDLRNLFIEKIVKGEGLAVR